MLLRWPAFADLALARRPQCRRRTMRSPLLASLLFSTLMACGVNEADPTEPRMKLTSTEVDPVGGHCKNGGVAVHTGIDTNNNGTLDHAEIQSTTYSCSHETLLREDPIASGVVCTGGGEAVHSGHDTNDNTFLDDSEIENTVTVCQSDELYKGDLKTSDFTSAQSR